MAGVRRCLGTFVISLVLVPSSAAAHSNSVETNPDHGATLATLPAEATVTFNEAPRTADFVLASPDGEIHQLKTRVAGSTVRAQLPAQGPRGRYTLSYRVVSADGHPVSGSIQFTITTGAAPQTAKPTANSEAPKQRAESSGGPLGPVVFGVAVLGAAAVAFAARSMRR